MFENKEQQFFGKEETELERKQRLGKEAEWTLALPLFQDMQEEGIFSQVEHTAKEVDEKKKIDFICKLGDSCHLGIQFSTSASKEIWKKKINEIIGEQKGKPYEELKDVHPRIESLSRRERIEKVPTILLSIGWETVSNVYKNFEKSGRQGTPFDFLTQKREVEIEVLRQMLESLRIFASDKKLAQKFPELPPLARQRYEILNKAYADFIREKK